MDYKKLIENKEYDFLRENHHLKENIMVLAVGGSRAYGTNNETSDVDIRGCALERPSDLIGFTKFDQVIETNTDTTIYSFNKMIGLLLNMNPNVVEILGSKDEHYIHLSAEGKDLLENKEMFMSKRCIGSFGGYAGQQLNRMKNKLSRGKVSQVNQEVQIKESIESMMYTFESRYAEHDKANIKLNILDSTKSNLEKEIYLDIEMKEYPLRDFAGILSEMLNIIKTYGKINSKNNRDTDAGIDKHAMHLIRLYVMVLDILERGKIITYRENDIELLMSIRNGEFRKTDGSYDSSFFEMIDEYKRKIEYAIEHTNLPDKPNMKRIEEYVMSVNKKIIGGK